MYASPRRRSKNFIPEDVLKRRNRDSNASEQRGLSRKHKVKTARGQQQQDPMKRAEKFVKEYRQKQTSYVDIKKRAKIENAFTIPSNVKILLVVRIRGNKTIAPQVKKVFGLFRLRQIYSASFVRVNSATLNMLKRIERYVSFGYPSRKVISDLIYKRGYAKVDKQRIPLSSNELIEKYLGEHGMICIEDVVHEIHSCGEHFKEANNFLWSFKLNETEKDLNNKNKPFRNGGDWGNREEKINELVEQMI